MKHFRVLQYVDVDELAAAVEVAINDSWELHGPMFTSRTQPSSSSPMGESYNQPIIKITREEYKGWRDCVKPKCNEPTKEGSNYCEAHKPDLGEDLPIG